jgi:hypothetical protein
MFHIDQGIGRRPNIKATTKSTRKIKKKNFGNGSGGAGDAAES